MNGLKPYVSPCRMECKYIFFQFKFVLRVCGAFEKEPFYTKFIKLVSYILSLLTRKMN